MRNKFTSVLMSFIIIAIFLAFGLLGAILWQEVNDKIIIANEEIADETNYFNNDDTQISKTIDEDIEVPKIKNTTNPLLEANEPNIEEVQINYNNISVNKYFYNQLNEYSQTIYKGFEENKENMKSGNYKINFGNAFSDILSNTSGQEKLGDYYQSAIEAYTYDNPDVFYLSPSKMYLNIETTTIGSHKTYNCYIDCGEDENYFSKEFSTKEEVEQAIGKIEKVRDIVLRHKTGNTYSDIRMVHNFLVDNLEYETTASQDHIYDIYGALVNNNCVCEGYAKAFKYLLDNLGIESTIIIGKGTNTQGESENHAWNCVKLDGNWYCVDCTWDDPIIIGGLGINTSKYKYFLKGSSTFNVDHFPSGIFTEGGKEFIYPKLSMTDY